MKEEKQKAHNALRQRRYCESQKRKKAQNQQKENSLVTVPEDSTVTRLFQYNAIIYDLLSLNSCNVLIPKIPSLSIKYIMAILNSRIAQFYFRKQFNSVKVLRSHIEQIPIPNINEEAQNQLLTLVDSILCASSETETIMLYEMIDSIVSDIFELSAEEYNLIKESMTGENLFLIYQNGVC